MWKYKLKYGDQIIFHKDYYVRLCNDKIAISNFRSYKMLYFFRKPSYEKRCHILQRELRGNKYGIVLGSWGTAYGIHDNFEYYLFPHSILLSQMV